jgi:hypothetical protein
MTRTKILRSALRMPTNRSKNITGTRIMTLKTDPEYRAKT